MSGARAGGAREEGALAIVLHTHMPYVEGFGTWPFGEEWLWEAIAGCYLPLLDLLDAREPMLTLSITPVLCDQLGAPGLAERFHAFIEDTRRFTHAEDAAGLRAGGHDGLAAELERAWTRGLPARLARMAARGGRPAEGVRAARLLDFLGDARRAAAARDRRRRPPAGAGGVASHLARVDADWQGGFWLPECAHAPHLEPTPCTPPECGARAWSSPAATGSGRARICAADV